MSCTVVAIVHVSSLSGVTGFLQQWFQKFVFLYNTNFVFRSVPQLQRRERRGKKTDVFLSLNSAHMGHKVKVYINLVDRTCEGSL